MTDLTGAARERRRRWAADDGQSTLEWMGIAAVVVGILAALLLASPGLGSLVQTRWQCLFASATGDGAACDAIERAGEPRGACTTSITTGSVSAGVRVAIVDLEGGKQVLIRETSDGKVHVTFIDDGSVGVSGQIGGGASADVLGSGVGGEAKASAGAALGLEDGDTRVFDDPEDAEAYIIDRAIDEGLETLPPIAEQGAGLVKDLIGGLIGHDPPQGSEGDRHSQVDIGAEASGTATAGILGGDASLAIEAGARVITKPDGSRTIRLRASGEVAGSLGIPIAAGADGSARTEVHLELDVDADGNPTAARVRVIGEGGGGASLTPTDVTDAADGLQKIAGSLGASETERTVVVAELDLTDPDVGDAFGDLVGATVDAATGDGTVREIGDAGDRVLDELAENGTLSVEAYDVTKISAGAEASANVGIGVGASVGVDGSQATLVGASYFDPIAGRFVPWEGCLEGAN